MKKFIFRRLIHMIIIMIGVSFFTFALIYLLPSDPVTMKYISMGEQPDLEVIEAEKEKLGLNDPFFVQYFRWVKGVVKGNFGTSIKYNVPVKEKLFENIPNTLLLAFSALSVSIIFMIPLGLISAIYQNSFIDYIIRFFTFIGISMPSFWLGMLLMYYFAIILNILPVMGMGTINHLILPSLTLAIWYVSMYVRRIRVSFLEEMNKEYVVGLVAKGISNSRIIFYHILPNSLVPILTTLGMSIGYLLGGTMIIETIFEWKGIGRLAIEAIHSRDFPIIQGYVIWMSAIFVLINLLVDILQKILTPHIKFEE